MAIWRRHRGHQRLLLCLPRRIFGVAAPESCSAAAQASNSASRPACVSCSSRQLRNDAASAMQLSAGGASGAGEGHHQRNSVISKKEMKMKHRHLPAAKTQCAIRHGGGWRPRKLASENMRHGISQRGWHGASAAVTAQPSCGLGNLRRWRLRRRAGVARIGGGAGLRYTVRRRKSGTRRGGGGGIGAGQSLYLLPALRTGYATGTAFGVAGEQALLRLPIRRSFYARQAAMVQRHQRR